MLPSHSLVCVLAAIALLSGCDRPSGIFTPAQSAGPDSNLAPTVPAPVSSSAASPEEAIALRRLAAQWPQTPEQARPDSMVHQLLGRHVLPGWPDGSRVLLVYASRLDSQSCNACSPELSFFEFRISPVTDPPTLVMASLKAASLGYGGEAPRCQVQALGGRRYAIVCRWNANAQGVYQLLSVLMPIGGRMREVFGEEIGGSHDQFIGPEGRLIDVSWKSFYRFLPGPGPTLDLHLERQFLASRQFLLDPGQGPFAQELTADGRVPTYRVYRFDGQRYRRVLAEQRPPSTDHEGWRDSDR